jgi:cytochrome d ubiquinol oxidase subunit I
VGCIAAPFLANTFGWLFTEMGRQPWIVYGLMATGASTSPSVSVTDVALTFGGFVLLYTVLGIIDVLLMFRSARRGLAGTDKEVPSGHRDESAAGEFIY